MYMMHALRMELQTGVMTAVQPQVVEVVSLVIPFLTELRITDVRNGELVIMALVVRSLRAMYLSRFLFLKMTQNAYIPHVLKEVRLTLVTIAVPQRATAVAYQATPFLIAKKTTDVRDGVQATMALAALQSKGSLKNLQPSWMTTQNAFIQPVLRTVLPIGVMTVVQHQEVEAARKDSLSHIVRKTTDARDGGQETMEPVASLSSKWLFRSLILLKK